MNTTEGYYNNKTGVIVQPSKLFYKSLDPLKILSSGVIDTSSVHTGVSLTSKYGIESHGPFQFELGNLGLLNLIPAIYGVHTEKTKRLKLISIMDQFGNLYTPEEWDKIPLGKPFNSSIFRQNAMFQDEHEWRSLYPVSLKDMLIAKITVFQNQAGWRLYPRKNKKILKEIQELMPVQIVM